MKGSPLQLQPRDLELLRTCLESRVMTMAHVRDLHFDGKKDAAKKRLQKLKAAGLIGERKRNVNEQSILFLTRAAFATLQNNGILHDYPPISISSLEKRTQVSDLTIRHELEVMDVKAAFHTAITKTEPFRLTEFCTWPVLNEFDVRGPVDAREAPVKPDGFVRIQENGGTGGLFEHTFFLEVDRSHEVQEELVQKATRYFDYYKTGGFAVRNGAERSNYKDYPFRVLMVLKTPERRNNTAERLLLTNPPILTQVCLTTLEEVTTNPLGAIWICPRDYREATEDTQFAPSQSRPKLGYKRQPARELMVEKTIKKSRLLV